jgi:hypothetical protein
MYVYLCKITWLAPQNLLMSAMLRYSGALYQMRIKRDLPAGHHAYMNLLHSSNRKLKQVVGSPYHRGGTPSRRSRNFLANNDNSFESTVFYILIYFTRRPQFI